MQEKKTTSSSSSFFFFYFTILYWFCHTLTWILHRCACVPHPEASSHLPPHPIPLGHSSVSAPSTLYHTSNLDWWSISHMIILMFQCHSPKSSHPRPLPQSPKLFYTSVSLLLSCIQGYNYHLSTFWPSVFFTILSSPVPVAIVASLCLWGHCLHYCISQDLCPSSLQRRLISHIWIWVTKDQVACYLLGGLANKSNINLNSVKATYREITYQWFQSKNNILLSVKSQIEYICSA